MENYQHEGWNTAYAIADWLDGQLRDMALRTIATRQVRAKGGTPRVCPVCGSHSLEEQKQKLVCSECKNIIETCCSTEKLKEVVRSENAKNDKT